MVIFVNKLLIVKDLKKHFITDDGIVKAVNGISFTIKEGEIFALVGESGSGKSTVGYTIVGIYKPTNGRIIFKEKFDISMANKKRFNFLKKEIQIVFQDPGSSLNPMKNIKQILELPLKVHKIGRSQVERNEKIRNLLELIRLPDTYIYKYPSMISGGEKQRIAIARVLVMNPRLLVLDEPTASLDVSVQAKIISMLIQFQKELNLSYLFITHDLSLVRNIADRVAIMYLGKICELASTRFFFKKPLHPYTQMLLSSIPVISDEEENLKPKKVYPKGEIPSPVNIPIGCSFNSRCHKCMGICLLKDPIMTEVENKHYVRCHLYRK